MTHAELVTRAERWLRKSRGCQLVVTRPSIMAMEQPDALGFNARAFSICVECKASRSDFLRDQDKPHRKGMGCGNQRYYMAPPGLIRLDEVPNGWGLLECEPRRIKVRVEIPFRTDRNWIEEMRHLVAENRRGTQNPEPFLFVG